MSKLSYLNSNQVSDGFLLFGRLPDTVYNGTAEPYMSNNYDNWRDDVIKRHGNFVDILVEPTVSGLHSYRTIVPSPVPENNLRP